MNSSATSLLMVGCFLATSPSLASAKSEETFGKIAVMPLSCTQIDQGIVSLLDDLIATHVQEITQSEVITAADMNAMLGLEKMKSAVGCDDLMCAAEIGGSLGVDRMVTGSVGKLGDQVFFNLKLINIRKASVEKRVTHKGRAEESHYAEDLNYAVLKLFGKKVPAKVAEIESAATPKLQQEPKKAEAPQSSADPANELELGPGLYHPAYDSVSGSDYEHYGNINTNTGQVSYLLRTSQLLSTRVTMGVGTSETNMNSYGGWALLFEIGEEISYPLLTLDNMPPFIPKSVIEPYVTVAAYGVMQVATDEVPFQAGINAGLGLRLFALFGEVNWGQNLTPVDFITDGDTFTNAGFGMNFRAGLRIPLGSDVDEN
ncbi:hypothetical protein KAI87_17675 [Myxococcota bacterium]|nr:hypothetical protein [Myxococcota bacterium]